MDNNKSFFYYTTLTGGTFRTNVGITHYGLDLRRILGQKYDKFEAFNLAIEAVHLDGGTNLDDRAVFCIHVDGFPFMNNYYDSLGTRSSSRVLEVVSQRGGDGVIGSGSLESHLYSSNFLQNIHRIPFYKPNTPVVDFTTFVTSSNGTFYERQNGTGYSLIFSITGIDAYRVRRLPKEMKPVVYKSFSKANPTLVLNSAYATSVDPIDTTNFKKRIFRFENVNWRRVIGEELYNKYDKFALVTRRLSISVINFNFSTNAVPNATLYLSGSNLIFENRSDGQFVTANTNATSLHSAMPVIIGTIRAQISASRALMTLVDSYIENVFYKPTQDIGHITIHYSDFNSVALASASTMPPDVTNSTPYPTLITQFEIIPVVDVRA